MGTKALKAQGGEFQIPKNKKRRIRSTKNYLKNYFFPLTMGLSLGRLLLNCSSSAASSAAASYER
jgi:hypothetical protein